MCNGCKYHSYSSASCWIQGITFTMPELGLQSLHSKLVCWDMQMNRRFVCLGDSCTPTGLMENTMLGLLRPLSRNGATAVKWSSIESMCRVSTFSTTLTATFECTCVSLSKITAILVLRESIKRRGEATNFLLDSACL